MSWRIFSDELIGGRLRLWKGGWEEDRGIRRCRCALLYEIGGNYSIPIKKFPLEEKGSLHPHSHCPWEIGGPFQRCGYMDQFWENHARHHPDMDKREGKGRGEIEGIPDCLIRYRFLRKHDQSSEEASPMLSWEQLALPMPTFTIIRRWPSITSVTLPWVGKRNFGIIQTDARYLQSPFASILAVGTAIGFGGFDAFNPGEEKIGSLHHYGYENYQPGGVDRIIWTDPKPGDGCSHGDKSLCGPI